MPKWNSSGLRRLIRPRSSSAASGRFVEGDFDLDLAYVTDDLIVMGFPGEDNDPIEVQQLLTEKHRGKYMIWNMSESTYDYSLFNDQVLDFGWPGDVPQLVTLFQVCQSVCSWLAGAKDNVAVFHCDGQGMRAGVAIASTLAYRGTVKSAAEAIALYEKKSGDSKPALTPSLRRYVQYLLDVRNGAGSPMLRGGLSIKRIIFKGVPRFERDGSLKPYADVLEADTVVFNGIKLAPREVSRMEGMVALEVGDHALEGDIVIRFMHQASRNSVHMCSVAFHTSFLPRGLLRLTRMEVDLHGNDDRFPPDFHIDLLCEHKPTIKEDGTLGGALRSDLQRWEAVLRTLSLDSGKSMPSWAEWDSDAESALITEYDDSDDGADGSDELTIDDLPDDMHVGDGMLGEEGKAADEEGAREVSYARRPSGVFMSSAAVAARKAASAGGGGGGSGGSGEDGAGGSEVPGMVRRWSSRWSKGRKKKKEGDARPRTYSSPQPSTRGSTPSAPPVLRAAGSAGSLHGDDSDLIVEEEGEEAAKDGSMAAEEEAGKEEEGGEDEDEGEDEDDE